MKISHTVEFPAPPHEVFEMLAEPRFQEAKCGATAAIEHAVSVELSGDRTIIKTERVLPTRGLPDFAKSMVGDTLKVGETQDWGPAAADGSRQGTHRPRGPRAPLVPQGHGAPRTRWRGDRPAHRRRPQGARCPSSAARSRRPPRPPIEAAIEIEHQTGVKWLNGEQG